TPPVLDPLAELTERQDAQVDLIGGYLVEPGGDAGIASSALTQLGYHVGVEEEAQRSTSRPRSGSRSKSASSPPGGIASRCSLMDFLGRSGRRAWRRISRCPASAGR